MRLAKSPQAVLADRQLRTRKAPLLISVPVWRCHHNGARSRASGNDCGHVGIGLHCEASSGDAIEGHGFCSCESLAKNLSGLTDFGDRDNERAETEVEEVDAAYALTSTLKAVP